MINDIIIIYFSLTFNYTQQIFDFQMDNFGFKTQGMNYDAFRPKYPAYLFMDTLNKIQKKNKYLDVAMGTGQLLFVISQFFKKSVGVDPSSKMFQTSLQKLKKLEEITASKIQLRKMDVMSIPNSQKFDLITIGQALHWFPIEDSLRKLKQNLQPQGRLLVLGYVVKDVQYKQKSQTSVSSSKQLGDSSYDQFYQKVKPYFDFDRDDLHTHYSDQIKYPFQKIFKNVNKQACQIKIQMNFFNYVNYLKTYSGYNQYLLKHKEDPIKKVEQKGQENRVVVMDYFKIQCHDL